MYGTRVHDVPSKQSINQSEKENQPMEDCIIFVRTEEESERVQKVLLAAGAIRRFGPADPKEVAFTEKPFIVLRNGELETLGFFKSLEDHSDIAKHVDENYVTDVTFPPTPTRKDDNRQGQGIQREHS